MLPLTLRWRMRRSVKKREVCSGGAGAVGKISQEDVIRYVERHAQALLLARWIMGRALETFKLSTDPIAGRHRTP